MLIDTIKIIMTKVPCLHGDKETKKNFSKITDFLRIINEPNRLKILCYLRHGEKCVCEIWENLNLPQNLTSHHLKTLKDFGLIDCRKDGRKFIYSSNKKNIKKYSSLLNNFLISKL